MIRTGCPLCKSEASYTVEKMEGHTHHFECRVCGMFETSDYGCDPTTDPQSPDINYGKISAWTRQEHEAGRRAAVTKMRLSNPPKIFDSLSAESKIIRALQVIARKWPVPGTNLRLSPVDWPLFCDSGLEECRWIMQALFERELIFGKFVGMGAGGFNVNTPLTAKAWAELEAAKTKHQQHNLCFVAMRFLPEFAPLFAAMERACHRAGYECKRVDTDPHADHIDNRLIDMLNRCRFVIADFTEDSRNVYFEAGYARGMGKSVIWTRRATQVVAFDTNQFYFIDWQDSDWAKFEFELETSIGAVVGRLAPLS